MSHSPGAAPTEVRSLELGRLAGLPSPRHTWTHLSPVQHLLGKQDIPPFKEPKQGGSGSAWIGRTLLLSSGSGGQKDHLYDRYIVCAKLVDRPACEAAQPCG